MAEKPEEQAGESAAGGSPEGERLRILRMVQEGKVTPEEGAKLLESLGRARPSSEAADGPPGKRHVVIHVNDHRGDQVVVRVPLTLARVITRFLPQGVTYGDRRLSAEELVGLLEAGEGDIVHVADQCGDQVLLRVE